MDVVQYWSFIDHGPDEKDISYRSKYWSVFFYLYLKQIVFRCETNDWIDDRLVFDRCDMVLRFMDLGADEKDILYLSKHWFVFFCLYLKKNYIQVVVTWKIACSFGSMFLSGSN